MSSHLPDDRDDRPALVLVAVEMERHSGSERGRAWAWACSLARHYRLHIIASPSVTKAGQNEDLAAGWLWHTTRRPTPTAAGLGYYREYLHWCREVSARLPAIIAEARPLAVHHITLGSFRVLPRYDRCGVPFVLGPIGGGEVTPRELLPTARLPAGPRISEWMRPWLNDAFALMPALRAVMRRSRLAIATSSDTERVLQRMGASTTAIVYPDRLPADVDPHGAQPVIERLAALRQCVRLVWSGRAVWWKAGQLAIELLRRLRAADLNVELTVFSHGHALDAWRRNLETAGVAAWCRVSGFVSRSTLLAELGRSHVFVYPTLHDSSSPALLEAYAMGLPSLTVGLGGPAVIATENTGYNVRPRDLDQWLDGAVDHVRAWQCDPTTWAAASEAARKRAQEFGERHLDNLVDRWLAPEVLAR